jgi:hypothetical protein
VFRRRKDRDAGRQTVAERELTRTHLKHHAHLPLGWPRHDEPNNDSGSRDGDYQGDEGVEVHRREPDAARLNTPRDGLSRRANGGLVGQPLAARWSSGG